MNWQMLFAVLAVAALASIVVLCCWRNVAELSSEKRHRFQRIRDKFETLEQVQEALRAAGLESSQLVVGIDFTKSNVWTGARAFNGRCLHDISSGEKNPYQRVIEIIGRTLAPFDDDGMIPVFGFGDVVTTDTSVFALHGAQPCRGFEEALRRYTDVAPTVSLSGPTSFAPIIRRVIADVRGTRQFTILLLVADGQVNSTAETEAAIVEASRYPISIVMVGVGDGPFDEMERFDDGLPARAFDNFQFVNWTTLSAVDHRHRDAAFAIAALQEIPDQFRAVQRLRML